MGAFTSVAEPEDTNTSFTVAMEQTLNTFTAHYPSSAHFQKRISSSEWSEFVNAMSDKFLLYMRVFLGCFVVCFLSFIIGAALSPIAFVLWLFLFPVMFAAMLMHQSEISKVVDMYNEALFRPRGVVMEYHKKRGKHDSAKLRVCLGYPATSESVATLGVKNNAHCPPALLERFAAANSEFSRSAYALSSASGPEGCVGGAGGAGPGSVMQASTVPQMGVQYQLPLQAHGQGQPMSQQQVHMVTAYPVQQPPPSYHPQQMQHHPPTGYQMQHIQQPPPSYAQDQLQQLQQQQAPPPGYNPDAYPDHNLQK
mmetsp:Transcript_20427/g.34411  ORF Transcript_20427/g.34411 Transcript_20427/m.34411 type:complete len:310 (+) Transcript_20427:84-1013(+)